MNPTAWKLFLEASELGSLSKVALLHGTSQPHVSRQIGELERSCGGRLFQRTGRGVTLSALGARIAPQVRAWLDSTEQLQNEIQNSAARPLGRVRLGIIPSVAHPFTSDLLQRLSGRYPLIQMRVREGQGSQLQNWLDEGSLDLAVLLRGGPVDHHNALALAATDTYLVAATGDRLTRQPTVRFADLAGLPLVTFCRPSEWRDQLDGQARALGFRLQVQLEADSLNLQIAMVAGGGAYALLGGFAIAPALAQGLVQAARVVEPSVTRHVAIAVARAGELTLATRTVLQEAQAVARDMAEGLATAPRPAVAASGPPAPSRG